MLIFVVGQFMAAYKYSYEKCIGLLPETDNQKDRISSYIFLNPNISAYLRICKFDVCVTVRHWYNNINNQLDATITVY